jgi:hypothetical protein
MWKGGKQTAECINGSLITIPDGIDQGTQVLDFQGNNLQTLPRERFQRMGLLNLQKIYLMRCRIKHIDDRAFRGLTNLVELDLSENLLTAVPTETFSDYHSLMRLAISGNPIRVLKTGSFLHLSYLTNLEISNCEIEMIDDDAFSGLGNLEWLKLDGNRLNNIRGTHILPESLHGIDLHRNPWQCDCRLLELRSWLLNYNVPQTIEPTCVTPHRLSSVSIKALELEDLACLPDVTPTTLYLEIAEGRNVSLLCKVSAVPEARVSWWFQGRVLQNDSMVAPGLHLYYFVEEGTEEKRSELFIFNANTDDNGTFVCVAENPAGKAQSNYTIRIIIKEEPIVGVPTFPYEHVIIISAATAVLALIIITILSCIIRCYRQRRRRRKKERSKVVALQHQHQHQGKTAVIGDSENQITRMISVDTMAGPAKVNGTVVTAERHHHDMILLSTAAGETIIGNDTSRPRLLTPYGSPPSLRNYQLEQNPDLINDTESVGKERRPSSRRGDVDSGEEGERENSGPNSYQEAMENIIHDCVNNGSKPIPLSVSHHQLRDIDTQYTIHMATLPRGSTRDLYHHHTADVHLSPGRFLDSDGYPVDYGLPKLPAHLPSHSAPPQAQPAASFYRTLPHSRPNRLDAASPCSRYSREAEFLGRSLQPAMPYEHYTPPDVRYTVEGYPCAPLPPQTASKQSQISQTYSVESSGSFPNGSYLPSPPAPYKGEPTFPAPPLSVTNPPSLMSPPADKVVPWPDLARNCHVQTPSAVCKKTPGQEAPPSSFSPSSSRTGMGNTPYSSCSQTSVGDVSSEGPRNARVGQEPHNVTSKVTPQICHPSSTLQNQQGTITESPDEGYEGEGVEGTEI